MADVRTLTAAGRGIPGGAARRRDARAVAIDRRDVQQIVLLAACAVVALLPEGMWPAVCRRIARATIWRRPYARAMAERLPLPVLTTVATTRLEALRHYEALSLVDRVQLMRSYLPGGWRPPIELAGEEHLVQALKDGRGAILWVSVFASSGRVVKMALHGHGYAVSHLSRPTHGFSDTRFGMRWMNPIRQKVELRYLRERIVMREDGDIRAMRLLRERLASGGIVSVAVDRTAIRTVPAPFLDGHLHLATGPLTLARTSGAPLLPVFSYRDGRGFRVVIERPLDVPTERGRPAQLNTINRFAALLERYVLAHAGEWTGWMSGVYAPGPVPPS